jgi:hypothetical protein
MSLLWAIRKLVENGVDLNAPVYSDSSQGLPVIDYGIGHNTENSFRPFLLQLKIDPDLKIRLMRGKF